MIENSVVIYVDNFQGVTSSQTQMISDVTSKGNTLFIFIDEAHATLTHAAPLTFEQRKGLLVESIVDEQIVLDDIIILPLHVISGVPSDKKTRMLEVVKAHIACGSGDPYTRPTWVAPTDPALCKQLRWDNMQLTDEYAVESFTHILEIYGTHFWTRESQLTESAIAFFRVFTFTVDYTNFKREYEQYQAYKQAWLSAPFAPIFVTVDAVVTCNDQVLLIKRGKAPGKGLWAIPGGFLNPDELIVDGIIRELEEETLITQDCNNLSQAMLKSAIEGIHVFDDPNRSFRGRIITHAAHINLGFRHNQPPKVTAADDAAAAEWVYISDLQKMLGGFYDDHRRILHYFLHV